MRQLGLWCLIRCARRLDLDIPRQRDEMRLRGRLGWSRLGLMLIWYDLDLGFLYMSAAVSLGYIRMRRERL